MSENSILNWILGGAAMALLAAGCIDDPNQVGRVENRAGASGDLSGGGANSAGGILAIGGNGAVGGEETNGGTSVVGGAGGSSTGGASVTGPVVDELALTFHSCARLSDGTVKCWGENVWGELGDGTTANQLSPVLVRGLSGAVEIAAGIWHSCARLGDGTVMCWGQNSGGQLGDGTTTDSPTPVLVKGLP